MKSLNNKFNEEQIAAITFGEGPLLIVAGAGTGKTTVVTERIKHLISAKLATPSEILALTFTEKASREMEERVDQAMPYGITQMWISTFHAFCDRLLKQEGVHIGINPGYRLMNEAETILFFRTHLFKFNLNYFRPLGNPNKFIDGMINHFSRLKDEDVTPEQYVHWIEKKIKNEQLDIQGEKEELEKYKELANAFVLYEQMKLKEGMFDYADLISYSLKLFRERPNVLKRYQEQFTYILIDEFQDTNYAQNILAITLAGKRKNITVVGDDDQAIYRWRGAAISNMIQFRTHFPETKTVVLTKNYRSTKEILDRSYDLIQYNNPDRLEITENIDKRLESMRRVNGENVKLIYADRVENEAEAIAKEIIQITTSNTSLLWKDIAILVRANNHALPFTRALERHSIPYQFLGPGQLLRQPEVKDLISYLTVLSQVDETVAFYRILTMNWLDIDPKDIAIIVAFAKRQGMTLFDVCQLIVNPSTSKQQEKEVVRLLNTTSKEKIVRLTQMIEKHLGLIRKETAGQILYYFLEETGMLTQLTQYKNERDEQKALNIAKFFDRLKTYEAEHEDSSVFAVVDWLNLSLELGESPLASNNDWNQHNAVNILTVHSSKGLEFPYVFLVNLVDARFPSTERKEQIPIPRELVTEILPTGDYHLQEERRLFYVAMTRARDQLYFTAAKYYGDGKREKKLSPFIAESIGLEAIEVAKAQPVGDTKQLSLLEWAPKETVVHKRMKESQLNKLTYLSYSQIETFLTCPLQYKYRYIIKIPVPPSAALTFGDTIHRTLEAFYKIVQDGKHPSQEELLTKYAEKWKSVGYGNKTYESKMKAHGEKLLSEFYRSGYVPGKIPKKLEESFKLKITPMLTIGGKVDRVDVLPDKKIEIIDYKTGQSTRVKKNVKNDLQLSVYAMAATSEGIYNYRPEDVIVSFYFLENQEKISGTRTADQLQTAKDKIIQTAEEIKKSDFPAKPGRQCDFCEFRLICEAWQ